MFFGQRLRRKARQGEIGQEGDKEDQLKGHWNPSRQQSVGPCRNLIEWVTHRCWSYADDTGPGPLHGLMIAYPARPPVSVRKLQALRRLLRRLAPFDLSGLLPLPLQSCSARSSLSRGRSVNVCGTLCRFKAFKQALQSLVVLLRQRFPSIPESMIELRERRHILAEIDTRIANRP